MFSVLSNLPSKFTVKSAFLIHKCDLRVAVIGQSSFAAEVYKLLKKNGHSVVGVFTVVDKANREDIVATTAAIDNVPVFKIKSWRKGNDVLPEIFELYKKVDAELNVLPFCSQYIPMDIINYPKHKTICYHPSLLPKHRGVSAISWTLINGDKEAGFSVFWADEGLDTGPILIQRGCDVTPNDTVDSIYNRFLYPEGIKAMVEAVNLIEQNKAPCVPQTEEGASFEPSLKKKDLQKIKFNLKGEEIHNFIRGLDSSPGASTVLNGIEVKVFASSMWEDANIEGTPVTVEGSDTPAILHPDGLLFTGSDGQKVNVKRLLVDNKMIHACNFGKEKDSAKDLVLTESEEAIIPVLKTIWAGILNSEVSEDTDFFQSGAGSMDVVRLIEEIKENLQITLQNEDVLMSSVFRDFYIKVIEVSRQGDVSNQLNHESIKLNVNKMDVSFPNQLFINGEFVNSVGGSSMECINPANESTICSVQMANSDDVDIAALAAEKAFEGEWSRLSARDRGHLMFKLADLMEQNKEELATIESLDSGAVYTLALKTHVGMSIDTWKYFAGWCDKILGSTIPIAHARPNSNFTFTKREPIGVCGLITPWNYPLMMLSWKMAPCLAAGNTVVMKPSEVSPLTALKLAELSVRAGFPKGVINILPGTGAVTGEAISQHLKIRKVGFTGSTVTGMKIMKSAAESNLKKVSLELGGKSPLSMGGVFFNKGENCISAGRIFVDSNIYDAFLEKVVTEVKKMVVGEPFNRSTSHGPQNHKAHLDKLIDYCEKAKSEGARLLIGGKRLDRPGYYFEPTVFCDVEDHMFIAKEEAFGPIMAISKFSSSDVDAVIKRANSTEYGLASGIFTSDINKAMYFVDKIDSGTVFINTYNKTDVAAPFGGFKQSGFGKDLGPDALNEYLKTKCVTMEY
ncbi:hypothetical protein M8J76_012713 [Diaphorina citri]|nr:hypothetical protein M8J75_015125 [Diaphorina citri]KAI5727014.1 hypothetical protein M8J76_012713 [Diaphorina citri]